MSTFEDDRYVWRDTYFVLFSAARRPHLDDVEKAIRSLGRDLAIRNGCSDATGRFESMTLESAEDFAAMDISYLAGDEVTAHVKDLARELAESEGVTKHDLDRIKKFDARFDVMHFEHVDGGPDAENDEMLDPASLLSVLGALVKLTDGLGVDPQSGTTI